MNNISNTILLVEDSADDAAVLQRTLKKSGIPNPVQVVVDGKDAIEYLAGEGRFADRTTHPLPFLIFLDLKLPRRDGFEVLTWLKQQPALASVAVVVLTGSADGLDHQRAYALGARSYLVKPPAPDELQRVMTSMQIYWSRFGEKSPLQSAKNNRV